MASVVGKSADSDVVLSASDTDELSTSIVVIGAIFSVVIGSLETVVGDSVVVVVVVVVVDVVVVVVDVFLGGNVVELGFVGAFVGLVWKTVVKTSSVTIGAC